MDITLDFQYMDAQSCKLGDDRAKWIDEISFGAFSAAQIFKVGECDFSGDYPILDFARWLNIIAYYLKQSGTGGCYVDPKYVKKSRTEFTRDGDYVVIAEVERKSQRVICTAKVPLHDFVASAAAYREQVFEHCFQLFPQMHDHEPLRAWLADYPIPGPCNPSTFDPPK